MGRYQIRHTVKAEIDLGKIARIHRRTEAILSVATIDPTRFEAE